MKDFPCRADSLHGPDGSQAGEVIQALGFWKKSLKYGGILAAPATGGMSLLVTLAVASVKGHGDLALSHFPCSGRCRSRDGDLTCCLHKMASFR